MEPTSNVPGVQSKKIELRFGQREALDAFQNIEKQQYRIVHPTGYGKTLVQLMAYEVFRSQGFVNRCLILVPTDNLRKQTDEAWVEWASKIGFKFKKPHAVSSADLAYLYSERDKAEVFIITYQHGIRSEWLNRLLSRNFWLIGFDESHHLSDRGDWGSLAKKIISMPNSKRVVFYSATPIRTDRRATVGPKKSTDSGFTYDADSEVSTLSAIKEKAIRRPYGRIGQYFVDVKFPESEQPFRVTTESLIMAGVLDEKGFSQYEAKRQLRYLPEYISPMMLDALTRLDEKNLRFPGQNQMIVFAMSNSHAQHVAEVIREIGYECDWVGVMRTDTENEAILESYRKNELAILVQVAKAGEGFDNKRSSVLVFLNLIKSATRLLQEVGRGLRRNEAIPWEDDVCDIFASGETELATIIAELEEAIKKNVDFVEPREGGREPGLVDIPAFTIIQAEHYRTDIVVPHGFEHDPKTKERVIRLQTVVPMSEQEALQIIELMRREFGGGSLGKMAEMTDAKRRKMADDLVNSAVSSFVRNVKTIRYGQGEISTDLLGGYKICVHTKWIDESKLYSGVERKLPENQERKHTWVRGLNTDLISTKRIPAWLDESSALRALNRRQKNGLKHRLASLGS